MKSKYFKTGDFHLQHSIFSTRQNPFLSLFLPTGSFFSRLNMNIHLKR